MKFISYPQFNILFIFRSSDNYNKIYYQANLLIYPVIIGSLMLMYASLLKLRDIEDNFMSITITDIREITANYGRDFI